MRTVWRPRFAVDLARTLDVLGRGPYDPCLRQDERGAFWRASRTPMGASCTRFSQTAAGVSMESFGPGAEWAIANGPTLLGANDNPSGFAPTGRLGMLHRQYGGLRVPRTQAVYEAALRAVIEQLVSGREAQLSYNALTKKYGERAPGPFELWLPPEPAVLAELPFYDLRAIGIDQKRARTLRTVAKHAAKLERTAAMALPDAYDFVERLAGIGPWTAAEIAGTAWGDADAVSVGDYHLKNVVAFAFTGEARGTDERMLELLEPYRPHRGRVLRLLHTAGLRAPRFGPRHALRRF